MDPRYEHVVLGWNDGQDEMVEIDCIDEEVEAEEDVGELCSQERLAARNAGDRAASRGRSSGLTAEAVSSFKNEAPNGKEVADAKKESKPSTGKRTSDNCKKGKEVDKSTANMGGNRENSTSQSSKKRKQDVQQGRREKAKRLLQEENFSASSSRPPAAEASSFAREHSLSVEAGCENLEVSSSNAKKGDDQDYVAQLNLCVTCGRTRQCGEKSGESVKEAVHCSCSGPEAALPKLRSSVPCEEATVQVEDETDGPREGEGVGANRDLESNDERSRREAVQDPQESANTGPESRSLSSGASGRNNHDADNSEVESMWAFKDGEASTYIVKWKGRAHIHNSKLTEAEMMKLAPKRTFSFKNSVQHGKETKWHPLWAEPQRIIGKRTVGRSVEWLVKWKGLGYDKCTWEADSPGLKDIVALYEHWCEAQNQNVQPLDETKMVRFERLPDWFRGEPLQSHQLDLLNKLCECWRIRREGIVVCDLKQEQMLQIATFVGCLFLEFGVKRPVLLVTSREMLQNWETAFEQLSATLYTILYDGPRDVREIVKEYELKLIEGCRRVQVVLSTNQTVDSDVDFLKSIQWSALLVDRPRGAKSHNLSVFGELETMFHVVVVTATQEGTFDLLSFVKGAPPLECRSGFGAFLDLKKKLQSLIFWEAEGPPNLLREFWVPVQLSALQVQQYCELLSHNFELLRSGELCYGGKGLKDLVLELGNCCCHPYLVNSSLSTGRDQHLDLVVAASGKLHVLRMMLDIYSSRNQTVVLLTQGSRELMDILDDFLSRQFGSDCYERIQQRMDSSLMHASLQRFNARDSGCFVLLLDRNAVLSHSVISVDAVIIYESCWDAYKDTAYLRDIVPSSCFKYVKVYRMYSHLTVEERLFISALEGADFSGSMSAKELQEIVRWGTKDLLQMSAWVGSCGGSSKAWEELLYQGSPQFDGCKQRVVLTSAEEVEVMASFSADSQDLARLGEKLRTILFPKEGAPLFDVTADDFSDKSLSAKDFWTPLLSEKHLELGRSGQKRKRTCVRYDGDSPPRKSRMTRKKSDGPSEDSEAAREEPRKSPFEIEAAANLESLSRSLHLKLKSLSEALDIPRHVSMRAQELLVYVATHFNIYNSRGDFLGELALALILLSAEQMKHDLDKAVTIQEATSQYDIELECFHLIYAKLISHSLPRPEKENKEPLQAIEAGHEVADLDPVDAAAAEVPYCESAPVPDAVPPDRNAPANDKHEEHAEPHDDREILVVAKKRMHVTERLKMLEAQRLEWAEFYGRKNARRHNLLEHQARELNEAISHEERAGKRQQHEVQLRELEELDRRESQALAARQLAARHGEPSIEEQDTRTTRKDKERRIPGERRPPTSTPCAEDQCWSASRQAVATQDNGENQTTVSVTQAPANLQAVGLPRDTNAAFSDISTAALSPENSQRTAFATVVRGTDVAAQEQATTQAIDITQEQVNSQQHPVQEPPAPQGQGQATNVALVPLPPVDATTLQLRQSETPAIQQPQVEDRGTCGSSVVVPIASGCQQAEVDSEIYRVQSMEDISGVQRRVHFQPDPLKLEEKKVLQEIQSNKKAFEDEVARLKMVYGRRHQELNDRLAKVGMQRQLAEALRQKNVVNRFSGSPSATFRPGLDYQQHVEHPRQVPVVQQQQTVRVHSPVLGTQQLRHVASHQQHQCTTPVFPHRNNSMAVSQQQQHPAAQPRPVVPQHPRNTVQGVSAVADVVALAASQMLRTQPANRVQSPTIAAHVTTAMGPQQQYNSAGAFNLPPPSQMLRTQASADRVQTPPQIQGRVFNSTVQQQQQQRVQGLQQVVQHSSLQGLHQTVHGSQAVQPPLSQQQQQQQGQLVQGLQQVVQGPQAVQPPLSQQQRRRRRQQEQLVQGLQQVVQGPQVVQATHSQQLLHLLQVQPLSRQQTSSNIQHQIGSSNLVNVLQQQGGLNVLSQQQQVMGVSSSNAGGICLVATDAPPRLTVNHIIELDDDS